MRVLVLGLWITLAAALEPAAAGETPPILRAGESISIELTAGDAPLAGHGPSRTIPYKVQERCFVYVAATAESVDPFLRVSDVAGTLIAEDDNSGGGKAAFVRFPCEGGEELAIQVASAAAGPFTLTLHEVPRASAEEATRLETLRVRVKEVGEKWSANNYNEARAVARAAIDELLALAGDGQTEEVAELLWAAGTAAREAEDLRAALDALAAVLTFRESFLPGDHTALQTVREDQAQLMSKLGNPQGAKLLQEKVLNVRMRTLSEEDLGLQMARIHYGSTLSRLGDLKGARALQEKALEILTRVLPPDHLQIQTARIRLGYTMWDLGNNTEARRLFEDALEVSSRVLPDDSRELQTARASLASFMYTQGDIAGALALMEKVVAVNERVLPEDHYHRLMSLNLVASLHRGRGDIVGAHAIFQRVLDITARTQPDDSPALRTARLNLGITSADLGDYAAARALHAQVVEECTRNLPDEHRQLQKARHELAKALQYLGDYHAARVLAEKVLEVYTRTLPPEHSDLQFARMSLASTLSLLGDNARAKVLLEQATEILTRTRPHADFGLLSVRSSLAVTLKRLGDLQGARVLEEQILQVVESERPDGHLELQRARANLAATLFSMGALQGARALQEKALTIHTTMYPDDHRGILAWRYNLILTLGALGDAAVIEHAAAHASLLASTISRGVFEDSPRELQARAGDLQYHIFSAIPSLAAGCGSLPPCTTLRKEAFRLIETTRAAGLLSARVGHLLRDDVTTESLRASVRMASEEIARSATGDNRDAFLSAVRARDQAQQNLTQHIATQNGGTPFPVQVTQEAVAERLGADEAAVCYWMYRHIDFKPATQPEATDPPPGERGEVFTETDKLIALVIRRDQPLAWVDLGPMATIANAVEKWRTGFLAAGERGVGPPVAGPGTLADSNRQAGEMVRTLIFDPVRAAAGDATRLIVALDDVLHLVPLDALPDGDGVVGDRVQISVHTTLWELLAPRSALSGEPRLLSLGGIDYGAVADAVVARASGPAADAKSPVAATGAPSVAVRSGAWGEGFPPLPEAAAEVRVIGELFARGCGVDATAHVLEGALASKEALMRLAPDARYVHLATHGYFAAEAIASTADLNDASSSATSLVLGDKHVRGLSPMVLCGLALAGANLPPNAMGRIAGVITAEEIATLDLTNCELVVLSACDTNVGLRRAGQGIESLQKAVHMAGARSAVTSLWQVGDAATRELMCEFYRRLWMEKEPKAKALWQAKLMLRNAKDEFGRPRYDFRDWAGWVLTGEPD